MRRCGKYRQRPIMAAANKRMNILSDDVREQHTFDLADRVLQEQLALFQALQPQEIDRGRIGKLLQDDVEVAVLGFELFQHFLEFFGFFLQHVF
jgi:hypothetical protein